MQLKKLWIKDYKNLKNFSLDFEKGNHLSILIGNNGSGKSNVLEAISGIFAEWNGYPYTRFNTDYKVEYDYDGKNIVLEKNDKNITYNVDGVLLEDSKANPYLPSNVVALYSGEDLRLFDNFYFPKYESYLKDVYQKGYTGKMGMYYVNKYLWNIALLVLLSFYERFATVKDFLETELGISEDSQIQHIRITFNHKDYEKNKNILLKKFIDTINPERQPGKQYTITEWRKAISSSVVDFDAEPIEIFNFLMQGFMPKEFKIIEKIQILFTNGVTLESLSEGEKKLLLIKAVLEFVADENALLLLDEPDANIHESRKSKLYKLLKDTPNRDIVMTSHSPILAKIADEKELIYLESRNGIVSEVPSDKLNLVRQLASDEWNIMEAGVFLNSEKPLVLFEGKSDIDFVKRAIKLLQEDEPKYAKIDVDFLSFNGTSNAARFITDLQLLIPTRKLIVLCDNDSAGKDAIQDIKKLRSGYIKCSLYPMPTDVTENQFLLEDYFSKEHITKIIDSIINLRHPYKNLPKLGEGIKKELASNYLTYSKEEFLGFKPLLDKILELLEIN